MVEKPTTNYQLTTTPPFLVVVGETGSGKTGLAVELAERLNGEVICADSWTVRREVNIGTAKPSPADRARVNHHLLDVVEPCADFTAAVFKRSAEQAIIDIADRGKLAIMVGGTGLYIDGVIYNYGFMAPGDRGQRQRLNNLTARQLVKVAQAQGLNTANVDKGNKRRLIRLIETNGQVPLRQALRPNTLIVGLRLAPDELKVRLAARVDGMLAAGLEAEVRRLVECYGWDCEALKGIGYVQWREFLAGSQTLAEVRQRILNDTLRLAKRQRTWFKRNNSIHWLSDPSKFVDDTTTLVNNWL